MTEQDLVCGSWQGAEEEQRRDVLVIQIGVTSDDVALIPVVLLIA